MNQEPAFDHQGFKPDIDTAADWRMQNIPWRKVEVSQLTRREEFMPGASYGRNAWNELYKGETTIRFYVALPESLITTSNVLVVYGDCSMPILRDARPDLVKAKRYDVGLIHYYRWMGAPR